MGNCGSSLDCTQCYNATGANGCATEINVDPDIAGIGVLIAFFISAVITCIAILLGYVTDSLPLSALTDIDTSAIARYQQSSLATAFLPRVGHCWSLLKSSVLRILAPRREKSPVYTLTRERRQDAIVRLVLAFSDHQLVTGIAIMVAAVVDRCHLTVYELRIVECLAWFSATTHLATLPVLREYMRAHPIVRNWRIIGIYVFLVLLGFIQFLDAVAKHGNDGTIVQCVFLKQHPKTGWSTFLQKVLVYSSLAWKYTGSIIPFYFELSVKTGYILPKELQRDRLPLLFRGWSQYLMSFLSQIVLIAFSLAYGISKTVHTIWIDSPRISGHIQRMGFGQVVSIALISLPLLMAAEIYNETRGSSQMSSHVKVNHTTPSITNNTRLDDRPECTNPHVTSLPVTPRPLPSSSIEPTNDIPSLPILSPNLNLKPPKLARWIVCVFSLDLVLMIAAGITWPLENYIYLYGIFIWALRAFTHTLYKCHRVILSVKKLWLQRSERGGVKGKSTVDTVANIGDSDATQASGQVAPETFILFGRSNNAGPFRSSSSVSLHILSLTRRQDAEATVGMVPAESSN